MRHLPAAILVATSWAILATTGASAQLTIGVGAGALFPTLPVRANPDYNDIGWNATATIGMPIRDMPVWVRGSGFYGTNGHGASFEGDNTKFYGGLAGVGYTLGEAAAASAYVGGTIGFMSQSYESPYRGLEASESGLVAGGSGGIQFPLAGIGGFVEGYFLAGFGELDRTQLFGVMTGVRIPLGGD